jgi:regulator of protease activity HflC (stomatin/prohibitin superfamily)
MSASSAQTSNGAIPPLPNQNSGANKKNGTNVKGLLLLGLAFLVIVPPVYWFVDWRLAWFFLLSAPLVAYFLFLNRGLSRVFFFVFGIFVLALVTATVLQIALADNTSLLEDSTVLSFFLGGEELASGKQLLFSIVAGVLLGVLVMALPLLAVMYASSEWVLAERGAHIERKRALRLLWSVIMNIQYPWLIVEEGKEKETKPKGILPMLGGPGNVVIRPGNVVVFERRGEITRVVGPGVVQTKRFEQIRKILELKPMWQPMMAENVLTRDRIPLRVVFGVGYQLEPKSVVDARPEADTPPDGVALTPLLSDGVYQVYEGSVRKAVFQTAGDWQLTSNAVGENLLRDVMATYAFDQIFRRRDQVLDTKSPEPFAADQRTIREIEERVLEEHGKLAMAWGVHIRGFDIKAVELPEETQEQMIAWWRAGWRRRVALEEAEAIRAHIESRGMGEAAAIESIEAVRGREQDRLIDSLCRSMQTIQQDLGEEGLELAERLLTVIERLSKALSGSDRSTTVRYVEALERMADESGTKVLMVGARRQWLPPLLEDGEE